MNKKGGFKIKLQSFMRGRYGSDTLNKTLIWVYFALMLVTLTVAPLTGSVALNVILNITSPVVLVIAIARMFSRNIAKRQRENKAFRDFFKRQRNRLRDEKTHVYRKCPKCGAFLRLPRAKGKHKLACPRCKHRFEVRGRGMF